MRLCLKTGDVHDSQLPHHQSIRLRVGAEDEDVRADVDEAAFAVEGFGSLVPLPYAEPESVGAALSRLRIHVLQHRLGDAVAMECGIDIETEQLDRPDPFHARRDHAVAELR